MQYLILSLVFIGLLSYESIAKSWIRINQAGYEPNSIKIAVMISTDLISIKSFKVVDAITNKARFESQKVVSTGKWQKFNSTYRLDFSDFDQEGIFYLKVDSIQSPIFRITKGVYNSSPDFLLQYVRQQQCGYNPFLKDSCHTNDGFIIYHPEREGEFINVVGGYHDASDYLRYVTTTATATFQMLFAFYMNPEAFGDYFGSDGNEGSDGIPDVLNSALWGLEWLKKMNPGMYEMYHQVADDRDHLGFRLPSEDTITYGKGRGRPVYFVTGEPQGLMKYKNRSDGVASIAGKFASTFALATMVIPFLNLEEKNELLLKSKNAYKFAELKPGVCQTAPCRAPYFYEEENYVDDMSLTAGVMANVINENSSYYLNEAIKFIELEPVVPWIGKDTARHYQWYPFVNLAHYFVAIKSDSITRKRIVDYYQKGLELIKEKAENNPFKIGIPFIWCSNNLIASLLTQFRLYHLLSGDEKFLELEAAHRDWLFGCNPWGTSMIVGFPEWGDYPEDPHSAFSAVYNYKINGGLIDGPVYSSIFNNLIGIRLHEPDEYEEFQTDYIVYHDDYGDYSTNEPTLDGTVSLLMYLSFLHNTEIKNNMKNIKYDQGGIVRFDTTEKKVYLIFSAHEFGEGLSHILRLLKEENIKAGFFFTGDFLRNDENFDVIKILIEDGHSIGPHSDKHLLYCDWRNRDSLLITHSEFLEDLRANICEITEFGVPLNKIVYFLPPFEWYNHRIVEWARLFGLKVINFTPYTYTNADYTTPDMKNYISSDKIIENLISKHSTDSSGLNGAILLIHVGVHPNRTDRLYLRLDEIISKLKLLGYEFGSL